MQQEPVLLFDGVCNLCNGFLKLVIASDKKSIVKFASLQSAAAQNLLAMHGVLKKFESVVLLSNGKVFQKSAAALHVLRYFPWYWQWTQIFWLVPQSVRDVVYDWIAKNRYKWFGKRDACMIPTAENKNRFLS